MFVKDLISEIVSPLSPENSGFNALQNMDVFKVTHLPIVERGKFLGLISDADIYDLNDITKPLSHYSLQLHKPYLFDYQHIFDAFEILGRLKLTVIPVLDADNNYLGVLTLANLLQSVSVLLATSVEGAVIELDVEPANYSFSEIGRIVEDADTRILSCYVATRVQGVALSIILKIDRKDASPVIQAFERYGYLIVNSYSQESGIDEVAMKNYDGLMRYLNI